MPTHTFDASGTPEEKLSALCALAIQQQAHLHLLSTLVTELYASNGGYSREVGGALVDQLLPDYVAKAADDFRKYVLEHRIHHLQADTDSEGPVPG